MLDVTSAALVVADRSVSLALAELDIEDDTELDELMWNDLEIFSNLDSSWWW